MVCVSWHCHCAGGGSLWLCLNSSWSHIHTSRATSTGLWPPASCGRNLLASLSLHNGDPRFFMAVLCRLESSSSVDCCHTHCFLQFQKGVQCLLACENKKSPGVRDSSSRTAHGTWGKTINLRPGGGRQKSLYPPPLVRFKLFDPGKPPPGQF